MIELNVQKTEDGRISTAVKAEGRTEELIDELAAGVAHVVVMLADDLPAQDGLHESLARVVASMTIEMICKELEAREAATDKLPEA